MAEVMELTLEEKQTLKQFREVFSGELDEKQLTDDVFLLRWLIARDFDVEKSETMLRNFLIWRRENNIDELLNEVFPPEFPKLFPRSFTGKDKDGRPVFVFKWGLWDTRGACERGEKDLLVRWIDYGFEAGRIECGESRWKSDPSKSHSQLIVIADMEGFSFRQLMNKKAIESMLELVHHYNNYYPETMYKAFVINAPTVFSMLWAMIKNLLPVKTLSKVSLHGTNRDEWRQALLEYIEPDQLAVSLGGNLQEPDL